MGILKTIGYACALYVAVKAGFFAYNTYDKWKDEGIKPFAEHVVRETGRKMEDLGEYLQNINIRYAPFL